MSTSPMWVIVFFQIVEEKKEEKKGGGVCLNISLLLLYIF